MLVEESDKCGIKWSGMKSGRKGKSNLPFGLILTPALMV